MFDYFTEIMHYFSEVSFEALIKRNDDLFVPRSEMFGIQLISFLCQNS